MREIDAGLAATLAGGETTLCRCWRIRRADGEALGFTDHDRALEFEGVSFAPETGFTPTEMERSLGLSVDNLEAAGVLRADSVTEADILAGRYDGAEVTQWLVDWRDVSARLKVFEGRAGEIRRGEVGFEMELQGVAELLNRPLGRVFQRLCDAELGDGRCGVSVSGGFVAEGTVADVQSARRFEIAGAAAGKPLDFFSLGRIEWTSGANAGAAGAVRAHFGQSGGVAVVELREAPAGAVAAGDGFRLFAGCDKSAATCREKFGNFVNFRGFPLMPGEDWLATYPRADEAHDGGSLFHD